jgi:hypothetical protein
LVVFGLYEFSADVSKAAHWGDFEFWVLCDKPKEENGNLVITG